MGTSLLSIFILSCKIISLICLFISIHSYHWFQIDNYSVNKPLIQTLCISYGTFCNIEDQMPLPRVIVILPCILAAIGLLLEIINLSLLCSIWKRVRSMLNFFLEQTSIALSCATTIHCIWVTIVHIRISMEMSIVHLDWTFFAFGLATILIPIDCICSIARIMNNCRYEKNLDSKYIKVNLNRLYESKDMHSPLLNYFIFVCKLLTCISIFLSLNTHHWIQDMDGRNHRGPKLSCYDYGHLCYERNSISGGILFFYILALLNVIFESLNILFLCKRTRSRINLILEELGILTIIVFLVAGTLVSIVGFIIIRSDQGEKFDSSFFIFLLSVILALIDFICSLIRVVSYCRDNSFRSNTITYTSNADHGIVHIQP